MTGAQAELALPPGTGGNPNVTWEREGQSCHRRYHMRRNGERTGWMVRHCGHPTALRPYYVQSPQGDIWKAYRTAAIAQGVAIEKAGDSS